MKIDLDAIEARADAATPGPWEIEWAGDDEDDGTDPCFPTGIRQEPIALNTPRLFELLGEDADEANSVFVSNARSDVPALVARCRRLEAVVEAQDRLMAAYRLGSARRAGPAIDALSKARAALDKEDTEDVVT